MGERDDIISQQEVYSAFNQPPLRNTPSTDDLSEVTDNNHPCGDLLEGRGRKHYSIICVPLYNAILSGDWGAASIILNKSIKVGDSNVVPNDLVRYSITDNEDTPLHVAVRARNTEIVGHLLDMMRDGDLKLQNKEGNNAFCEAAIAGNVEIVKMMLVKAKNRELLTIRGGGGGKMMPLYLAASYGNHKTSRYLYKKTQSMTTDGWTDDDRNDVFLACVKLDIFDVASSILDDNNEKRFLRDRCLGDALHQLALNPYAFDEYRDTFIIRLSKSTINFPKESEALRLLKKILKIFVEKPKDEIDVILRGHVEKINGEDTYPSPIPFVAAAIDNIGFLVELIRVCPDLIWKINDDGHTIFHVAVLHRNENIYNLLHEIGSMKDMITQQVDKEGNNILHLAGKNPKNRRLLLVSGAAFQMHRELLWFKEVEGMVLPHFRGMKDKDGLTPHQVFTENHLKLASEGEEWIKGTVNQSMVAAALIATIAFSVVFSIPGGFDQNNGYPIFLHNRKFTAFIILDAISFLLSSCSILTFLSLMVSRYAVPDFIVSLPRKLMLGQATLFLSIFTVMLAFIASFFIVYPNRLAVIIGIMVTCPIIIFSGQQYVFFMDTIRSLYGSRYCFNSKKHVLYYKNPIV